MLNPGQNLTFMFFSNFSFCAIIAHTKYESRFQDGNTSKEENYFGKN